REIARCRRAGTLGRRRQLCRWADRWAARAARGVARRLPRCRGLESHHASTDRAGPVCVADCRPRVVRRMRGPSRTDAMNGVGGPRRVVAATVRMRVRPEKRDEFIQAMSDLTARARRAFGCVATHFYADSEDPNAFTLVEEWRRRRDLDRHVRSAEFAA